MKNLFATWHDPADVEIEPPRELDPVELLSLAQERLAAIPELEDARRLVAAALEALAPPVRSSACAGSR
jgi:hypothetical protein